MGFMDKLGGNIANGLMGNLSQIDNDELMKDYGEYIMNGETIQIGFKMIRDIMIITDKRIIEIDKQGATGQKMRINSINLDSVIHVTAETSGFGADDSEITITYITSPYFKVSGGVSLAEKTFEFPKSFDIKYLYRLLQETAYENHERINR
ncbi:hypothetical protein B5E58_08370 [Tyzzerella sp. An114]|uniref:PH domain-containing protein n=1 Tax=Tyzzerella sp. An114 TaxID=1965545 RepID=UPI000B44E862|nr:PH domain-containing protein [Tyzzerella sp. An114]OUQ57956.1 hypothetical protein B5E58_08370 [Tyzzerella sp. An114]HIT72353.1 PH domain-containing protein [Candidatus Fimicola cottocaccae]